MCVRVCVCVYFFFLYFHCMSNRITLYRSRFLTSEVLARECILYALYKYTCLCHICTHTHTHAHTSAKRSKISITFFVVEKKVHCSLKFTKLSACNTQDQRKDLKLITQNYECAIASYVCNSLRVVRKCVCL